MKLYGSHLCKDCPKAIEFLEDNNYKFEFIDISISMPNLREFIKIRDTSPAFYDIKNEGLVGIPALVYKDNIYIGDEIYDKLRKENNE